MSTLSQELEIRLAELAKVPVLLVASDYDGTLSPIVSDPAQAVPHREAMVALHSLAVLPRTHVTIISGRSLRDLAGLTGSPGNVHLVGSHGSEFDPDFAAKLPQAAIDLREELETKLGEIAEGTKGCAIEVKPASVAFHYRNAEQSKGERAAQAVLELAKSTRGVQLKRGKMVVELGVIDADKGKALETIRHRVAATAALFLGDDVTDEDAFATLRGPDLGIKVGPGDSAASVRIGSTQEVALVLARVAELRAEHLAGSHAAPIDEHSMLSDQRTVALVDGRARVTWLCTPRIDSPAIFSELLGGPDAGYFSVREVGGSEPVSQRYVDGSLVLETQWNTMRVTDYLDCSQGRPTEDAGRVSLIRVLEGTGRAHLELAPRLDFGRTPTHLTCDGAGVAVTEVIDSIVVRSTGVRWEIHQEGQHHTAYAEVDLSQGPVVLELCFGEPQDLPGPMSESDRREQTRVFWSDWLSKLKLPRLRGELMETSALVLRGLVHGPTGAIAAAGTTSLPEQLGGVRNWDYRYCWPRDASMSATTLVRLGSTHEAMALLDWMLGAVAQAGSAERLAPIYDVRGNEPPPEAEIAQLSGYAGSRPVRIGNAAAKQVQLDVFGPIAELVWQLCKAGAALGEAHRAMVEAMADAVIRRWREPDHGIWEIRGPLQHHVHSKTMCWVTLDRAAKIAGHLGKTPKRAYREASDAIRSEVIEQGWNESAGAFTASYGSGELDAAVLTMGLTGLIEPTDTRFIKTVEAIERHLRDGSTVYRYLYDDGLPGREGGFHICSLWLVEAYALIGRVDDAGAFFHEIADLAGPTGLLSEQHDPQTSAALGNHPQAYSHLGLIDAALRLESLGGALPCG